MPRKIAFILLFSLGIEKGDRQEVVTIVAVINRKK